MTADAHRYRSRWRPSSTRASVAGSWLLKWLLLIPHAILLAFLWIAVAVLWLVALFAVLFTERYPRGILDLVLGTTAGPPVSLPTPG